MIELVCDKNRAFFRETEKLTSGSIGVTINFVFSPEWDGLLKTVVFDAGEAKIDVVLTSESCEVPPEVLACPGKQLSVGVFGELADKTLVIPTIYAEAGIIRPGASPSGMSSAPPTPSWPGQVQAIALEAKEAADSVRSDAEAGKFTGPAGEAGGFYTPAVTQPDANTMRLSFSPSKEGMPAVENTDITLPSGGGGGGSGGSGEDGGYYTPAVTQPTENTMQVAFTPSKATMPAVDGTEITLPAGPQGTAGADGAAGADGKSAYAYAVDGGYTGTEAEFAAKLAQEKFANPNSLTFTGAVTGSYDGSEALNVKIPSGGSGGSAEPGYKDATTLFDVTLDDTTGGLKSYEYDVSGIEKTDVIIINILFPESYTGQITIRNQADATLTTEFPASSKGMVIGLKIMNGRYMHSYASSANTSARVDSPLSLFYGQINGASGFERPKAPDTITKLKFILSNAFVSGTRIRAYRW